MNGAANADMSAFWNGDAGLKWVRLQDMMDVSLMPLGQQAMTAAGISAGDRIIDVGCGCGDTTLERARRVGPGGDVLGIDISTPMLARAEARAETRAAAEKNVAFEHGDAQSHPFETAVFDVVFSRFGVMFFDDPVAAFTNLKSALKPGGRVAFVCWQPARDNPWLRLPLDAVARQVTLPAPTPPGEPGEFGFDDDQRVIRILTDAGFTETSVEKYDTPLTIAGGGDIDQTIAFFFEMGPVGRAITAADADDETQSRIAADLRDALAPFETEDGVVMGAATWIVTARKP